MAGKENRIALSFLTLIFSMVLMWSCKTKTVTELPLNETETNAILLQKVQEATPVFNTYNIQRMTVGINLNGSQYNSPASGRLIRDSIIHLSVQPFFGIEMFVAQINTEGIVVVDKTKGVYYRMSFEEIRQRFNMPFDFNTIQAVFTNQLFFFGEKELKPSLFKQQQHSDGTISIRYESGFIAQISTLDTDYRVTQFLINTKTSNQELTVRYADPKMLIDKPFPHAASFRLKTNSRDLQFNMNINRMEVDQPLSIPVLNLQRYRETPIEMLLK